jgi:hypothetical protein
MENKQNTVITPEISVIGGAAVAGAALGSLVPGIGIAMGAGAGTIVAGLGVVIHEVRKLSIKRFDNK